MDGDTVSLFHFQKVPDGGRIDITTENYTYAVDGSIAEVMGDIFTRFVEIFTDIFVNCTWINHESARILSMGEYQNFVASMNRRNAIDAEMHCWHIFDEQYFNQDKVNPPEFTQYNRSDPSNPVQQKDIIDMATFDYKVQADEIVPVVSSNATLNVVKETRKRVIQKTKMNILTRKYLELSGIM